MYSEVKVLIPHSKSTAISKFDNVDYVFKYIVLMPKLPTCRAEECPCDCYSIMHYD